MLSSPVQDGLKALRAASDAARYCEALTGLPAELSMAQWADESGWGVHSPGNNCFGIKAYPGCFATQELETHEFIDGKEELVKQEFAVFPTLGNCFVKHAELITQGPRYAQAWAWYQRTRDLKQLINSVAKVYATDPNYGAKLLALTRMQKIQASLQQQQV